MGLRFGRVYNCIQAPSTTHAVWQVGLSSVDPENALALEGQTKERMGYAISQAELAPVKCDSRRSKLLLTFQFYGISEAP